MVARKYKILIVEDDPFLLAMYSRKFIGEGFAVFGAPAAAEALAEAPRLKPQAILLDMMLPDEDGLSVLKKLKRLKETATVPVILLSNVSEPGYREQARILGATDYLVKAYFEPSEIVAKIKELIGSKI